MRHFAQNNNTTFGVRRVQTFFFFFKYSEFQDEKQTEKKKKACFCSSSDLRDFHCHKGPDYGQLTDNRTEKS